MFLFSLQPRSNASLPFWSQWPAFPILSLELVFRSLTLAEQCGPEVSQRADTAWPIGTQPLRPSGHHRPKWPLWVEPSTFAPVQWISEYQRTAYSLMMSYIQPSNYLFIFDRFICAHLDWIWFNHLVPTFLCAPYGSTSQTRTARVDVDEPVKVMQVLIQSGCPVTDWVHPCGCSVPTETPDSDLSCAVFGEWI